MTDQPDESTDQFYKTTVPWLTQARRAWLYRLCVAVGGILVVLGKITDDDVSQIIGFVGLILGNGTAASYTPTH